MISPIDANKSVDPIQHRYSGKINIRRYQPKWQSIGPMAKLAFPQFVSTLISKYQAGQGNGFLAMRSVTPHAVRAIADNAGDKRD